MEINSWLTPKLQDEVRDIFENYYQRKLSIAEIEEIALTFANVVGISYEIRKRKNENL